MEYLYLIFAMLFGFLIAYIFLKNKYGTMTDTLTLKKEYVSIAVFMDVNNRLKDAALKIDSKNAEIIELNRAIASQEQMIDTLREQNTDRVNENNKMHEKLKLDFELLSSRLLEEKGSNLMKQNQEQIGTILGPLKEKLLEFEKKIGK
jgi:DNA recombination protein RmuC